MAYKSKFSGQNIDDLLEGSVQTTPQELAEEQKSQARENIGAIGAESYEGDKADLLAAIKKEVEDRASADAVEAEERKAADEKLQQNIDQLGEVAVRTDGSQTFTEEQQEQARKNIGAVSAAEYAEDRAGFADALKKEIEDRAAADALLRTDLNAETAAREAADATLTQSVTDETAAREAAITAEADARAAADKKLADDLAAETAAREAADATLTQSVADETAAREAADKSLSDKIAEMKAAGWKFYKWSVPTASGECRAASIKFNHIYPFPDQMAKFYAVLMASHEDNYASVSMTWIEFTPFQAKKNSSLEYRDITIKNNGINNYKEDAEVVIDFFNLAEKSSPWIFWLAINTFGDDSISISINEDAVIVQDNDGFKEVETIFYNNDRFTVPYGFRANDLQLVIDGSDPLSTNSPSAGRISYGTINGTNGFVFDSINDGSNSNIFARNFFGYLIGSAMDAEKLGGQFPDYYATAEDLEGKADKDTVVETIAQSLNTAQKQQARTNIAAASKDELATKANKATTLAGYGITDAYTKTETNGAFAKLKAPNDLVDGSYEFTFIGGGIPFVNINYTSAGTAKSNVSQYRWFNGSGEHAELEAKGFSTPGGTASQFLKADGSVDSKEYLPLTGGTIDGNLVVNGYIRTHEFISNQPEGSSSISSIILIPRVDGLSSGSIADYMSAMIVWICKNYPNKTNKIFIGNCQPTSAGIISVFIYSTSDIDSKTGLPRYAAGIFSQLGGSVQPFGTNNFVPYFGGSFVGSASKLGGQLPEYYATAASLAAKADKSDTMTLSRELVDPDTITKIGVTEVNSTTNAPTNTSWHIYMTWGSTDSSYGFQLATSYVDRDAGLYYRHKVGGTWTGWKQLANLDDLKAELDATTIKTTKQTLTEAQQETARTNIGAAAASDLSTFALLQLGDSNADANLKTIEVYVKKYSKYMKEGQTTVDFPVYIPERGIGTALISYPIPNEEIIGGILMYAHAGSSSSFNVYATGKLG